LHVPSLPLGQSGWHRAAGLIAHLTNLPPATQGGLIPYG
jgi:hypothetical protein